MGNGAGLDLRRSPGWALSGCRISAFSSTVRTIVCLRRLSAYSPTMRMRCGRGAWEAETRCTGRNHTPVGLTIARPVKWVRWQVGSAHVSVAVRRTVASPKGASPGLRSMLRIRPSTPASAKPGRDAR